MRIAYIISAYKNADQLVRLVKRLDTPANSFLIHVDRRTPAGEYQRMRAPLVALPNVYFLERHPCHWGDFGHVRASLKGIAEIYRRAVDFDYAFLLTGQDYPMKSNRAIAHYLKEHPGESFLHHYPIPNPALPNEHGGLDRFQYWYVHVGERELIFPAPRRFRSGVLTALWSALVRLYPRRRPFPTGFQPYGGSGYWSLARDSLDYVHDFVQRHPAFVNYFRHAHIPDEIFFQTILLNSPFKDTLVNDDLRFAYWPANDAGSPAVLLTDDFQRLLAARPSALFARKFDTTQDARILDTIDAQLLSG
jgi:hypothetical protein